MTRDVPPPSQNIANTLRPLPRESGRREIQSVPGEALISLRDIHVGFEDREVLQGISFDVAHGETKVLLGETGTGKTLIMKLAAGLIQPDSGHVLVMGHDVSEMPERELLNFRRSIGFVFQEGALFDSMTVEDNIAFPLREAGEHDSKVLHVVPVIFTAGDREGKVSQQIGIETDQGATPTFTIFAQVVGNNAPPAPAKRRPRPTRNSTSRARPTCSNRPPARRCSRSCRRSA